MRIGTGILCSFLCSSAVTWSATAPPERIRDAATRAITLFQSSQKGWYSTQICNSALAFQSAREPGIPLDDKIAHADAVKVFSLETSGATAGRYPAQ